MLSALSFVIKEYYWVDIYRINEICRYKTLRQKNTHMLQLTNLAFITSKIPSWLVDWFPAKGGYLIGNLQPAHMGFRFILLGNLWAISSSLSIPTQADGILSHIEEKWNDLVANTDSLIRHISVLLLLLQYTFWLSFAIITSYSALKYCLCLIKLHRHLRIDSVVHDYTLLQKKILQLVLALSVCCFHVVASALFSSFAV